MTIVWFSLGLLLLFLFYFIFFKVGSESTQNHQHSKPRFLICLQETSCKRVWMTVPSECTVCKTLFSLLLLTFLSFLISFGIDNPGGLSDKQNLKHCGEKVRCACVCLGDSCVVVLIFFFFLFFSIKFGCYFSTFSFGPAVHVFLFCLVFFCFFYLLACWEIFLWMETLLSRQSVLYSGLKKNSCVKFNICIKKPAHDPPTAQSKL